MWFTVHHETSIRCRFERKRLFPSADKNGFIPHAFGWSNEDKTTVKKKKSTLNMFLLESVTASHVIATVTGEKTLMLMFNK